MFYLKIFWKSYARVRKNNTNCKKIHKLSSVFPDIILRQKFVYWIMDETKHERMNVPGQNPSAAPKIYCRVAVTHESVAKTHEIDVLVTYVKPAKRI